MAEATRQKILDAAQKLILLKGLARVTRNLIAREIGLTEGALYRQFDKKGIHSMSKNTLQSTGSMLTTPGKGHTTILTSFRSNGMGVGSPVGTVASQGKLYFMTAADTWKVKRLANNPRVTIAPGTFKGEALGPAIEGIARRLSGKELKRARDLLRVGVVGRFWGFIFDLRYPGDKTAVYEISLVAEGVDREMTPSTLP